MEKKRDFIIINRETFDIRFKDSLTNVIERLCEEAKESGENYNPISRVSDTMFAIIVKHELEHNLFDVDHTDNIPTESDVENENNDNTITL